MANNVADLKAETLNETPANVEAKVVVETKADTLRNVHTWQHSGGYEAIKYIIPDTLIEWDADTNEEIVVTIKAAALFNRVDQQLPESEAETLWCKLSDAEVQTTYGGCCLDFTSSVLPPIAQCKDLGNKRRTGRSGGKQSSVYLGLHSI